MKKKRRVQMLLLLTVVFIVLLVVGCQRLKRDNQGDTSIRVLEQKTGRDGLVITFLDEITPREIWAGTPEEPTPFQIGIEISNRGYTEVTNGSIALMRFSDYMEIVQQQTMKNTIINVKGKDRFSQTEGYQLEIFDVRNTGIPTDVEKDFLFKAKVCYPYTTQGSVEVCIDPFMYDYANKDKATCQVKDVAISGGQGAPVAVTKVEETIVSTGNPNEFEAQFVVHFKNEGKGLVTGIDQYASACTTIAPRTGLDKVQATIELSGEIIDCTNIIQSYDDPTTSKAYCTKTIRKDQGSFVTPLSITLSYGYVSEEIELTIKAKHKPTWIPDQPPEQNPDENPPESGTTCQPPDGYCQKKDINVCAKAYGTEITGKTCPTTDEVCCSKEKSLCEEQKGSSYQCIDESTCSPPFFTGLCPGPANIICCEPSS
ncbi:hypothetical protein HYW21_03235 [Candidatus Woesearchaeota archaeon]|nr:hypothetical protein [Candidatus Woesearchaeota archaeon]